MQADQDYFPLSDDKLWRSVAAQSVEACAAACAASTGEGSSPPACIMYRCEWGGSTQPRLVMCKCSCHAVDIHMDKSDGDELSPLTGLHNVHV
jgi:hypothetical protein